MSDTPDPKTRILEVAEEIFAEKGFIAATIREIVDRAGVNIAAVNYYFGDKERLYNEAVKFAHECSAKHAPMDEFPGGMPPVEKLTLFIREMTTRMTSPARPSSLRLMMRELSFPTAAGKEVVRDYIRPMALRLRGIVEELLPGIPEADCLMIGFSVIGQVLYYRQNRAVSELLFGKEQIDVLSTGQITEHVTRFTLAALGHAPPLRGGSP